MKIGVLTYHFVPNFGANLQTLSTVAYLKNQGHDPIVINWQPKSLTKEYKNRVTITQRNKHIEFLAKYLPLTEICFSDTDIINEIKKHKINAIIVGSDVVLRYVPWKDKFKIFKSRMPFRVVKRSADTVFPNPFWLSFINKDPELRNLPCSLMSVSSMGSSFNKIPLNVKKKMSLHLERLNYISVRDSWTAEMIKTITNRNLEPKITPDPVFGFNNNFDSGSSKHEILKKFDLPENYLIVSFRSSYLNMDWYRKFEIFAEERGVECVELAVPEGILGLNYRHKINTPLSPIDWYDIIRYSAGYVGQNMHPIVICIHNCIPFFSFDDYGGNTSVEYRNVVPSKTYDLILRTSFTNNHTRAKLNMAKIIDPKEVHIALEKFDVDHCKNISVMFSDEYEVMMQEMLNCLQ